MLFGLCRAYEEYQVETVYESVADLQFTHMASALISDTRGENHVKCVCVYVQVQFSSTYTPISYANT